MRVMLVHYRVGENDGVSLEMEKWRKVLQGMGHCVTYLSGSLGNEEGYEIPSIRYDHPENAVIHSLAFERAELPERAFIKRFTWYKEAIKDEVVKAVRDFEADLLIVNNIWSLAHNLAAGVAFAELMESLELKVVAHHHDFYWERDRYAKPQYPFVRDILETYFPPDSRLIRHVVINLLAREELRKRRGIDAKVIPNVFDFDQPSWSADEFNADLRKTLGISDNDLVFLQATRIVPRKAIELSLDFLSLFQRECLKDLAGKTIYNGRKVTKSSRAILLLAGQPEDPDYLFKLKKHGKEVGATMVEAFHLIQPSRSTSPKRYNLWDAYAISDVIMYPSIMEGWGNQFIEGIFCRKPMVVFEYPVFVSDILPLGFWYISLGREHSMVGGLAHVQSEVMERAVRSLCEAMTNTEEMREKLERNFQMGKESLSLVRLRDLLKDLLE